ncbi:LysR substrate-binding domain-containing protein, partial [Streptomyces sp. NPDC049577]|uniref:LysR substrate-binding domain-containing protein n=1 Tax=Streptomyces sp. NPDC049577 TaxID=3155153 RepID=UPI003431FFA5
SSHTLLQLLATNQLDVALVQETTGFPQSVPSGVERRVLVACEPRFVALAVTHPAASRSAVPLAALADDPWIVDPAADDEAASLRRAFLTAGLDPRLVQVRDTTTAGELVASGEAVRLCQPTTEATAGTVVRPIEGDPLTCRLSFASRPGALPLRDLDALFTDLLGAYLDLARTNAAYRAWLGRNGSPLLPLGAWPPGAAGAARRSGCAAGKRKAEEANGPCP